MGSLSQSLQSITSHVSLLQHCLHYLPRKASYGASPSLRSPTTGFPSSLGSPLTPSSHSSSSSTYKAENYSSSYSSVNGGVPKRESHHDSTYRSSRVGDSGIPHTSYSHTSSSYNSARPGGNYAVTHSYNI